MPYEVIGFRVSKKDKKTKARHFGAADSVESIFANPESYLAKIIEKERYNLFFSLADVEPKTTRHKGEQHFIPFDVDDVPPEQSEEAVQTVCDVVGVDYGDALSLRSGNGVQVLVKTAKPISKQEYSNGYFEKHRAGYQAILNEIKKELAARKIEGTVDASVFKATQVMRFPNTLNKKPNKPDTRAQVLNNTCEPVALDLFKYGEAEEAKPAHSLSSSDPSPYKDQEGTLKKFPPPQKDAVINGCDAIQAFISSQGNVPEPLWRAVGSIFLRLPGGIDLFHQYSKGHPNYSKSETNEKLERLKGFGPYTCKKISTTWEGCPSCPNFNKCKSPITLKSTETGLSTSDFRKINKDGSLGGVDHFAVAEHFASQFIIKTLKSSEQMYRWTGKVFESLPPLQVSSEISKLVQPPPRRYDHNEILFSLKTQTVAEDDFFVRSSGFINCNNGVVDLDKKKLIDHDPKYKFRNILPYDYDKDAKCPTFDRWIRQIMLGREDLVQILLEFIGYALMNEEIKWAKSLLLIGEGSNGKSTFLKILKKIFGKDNISHMSLDRLEDPAARYTLEDSMINLSAESPRKVTGSEVFKALVSGDSIDVHKMRADRYFITPKTKYINSCNDLPRTGDVSHGWMRRFIIIPFDYKIEEGSEDFQLDDKLEAELSGILNICIDAYKRLEKNNSFTRSKTAEGLKEAYAESNNRVLAFLKDVNFREHKDDLYENDFRVTIDDFFGHYLRWCDNNNVKYKGEKTSFLKEVKRLYPFYDSKRFRKTDGSRPTCITGCAFDPVDGVAFMKAKNFGIYDPGDDDE